MTLPAIGFVGLVFLFLFLIIGILVLILLTKHDLRRRLCETLASYRQPNTKEKPRKRSRRKKRPKDAYSPHILPGPTQLLQQTEVDAAVRNGTEQPSRTHRSNSLSRPRGGDSNRSKQYTPGYANNPEQQFAYPGAPLMSSELCGGGSKDMLGGHAFYPTSGPSTLSSGMSTPQHEGSEKKGILKNSNSSAYRHSGNRSRVKSVGYEDELHTVQIS